MTDVSSSKDNPSQWVTDVNQTLDYLQDDISDLKNASKRNNIAIMAVGLGLAIQGFVVMQVMKATRQISGALSQVLLNPPPMDPKDEAKARVLLNIEEPADVSKPVIMEDTEVKAEAGSPVEVGDDNVPDEVRKLLITEDNASIIDDPTPLSD